MVRIVTVAERKAREAARRATAAAKVMKRLRGYAASHGGRFIVFGSAARGEMRFNSDIDILADFPEEGRFDAIVFAEDACVKERLPCDVLPMPKTERMSEFMGRIRADMMELA